MNNKSIGSAFFDLRNICEGVRGRLIKSMIREVGEGGLWMRWDPASNHILLVCDVEWC